MVNDIVQFKIARALLKCLKIIQVLAAAAAAADFLVEQAVPAWELVIALQAAGAQVSVKALAMLPLRKAQPLALISILSGVEPVRLAAMAN